MSAGSIASGSWQSALSIAGNNNLDLSFANGGDQNNDTIPERSTCEQYDINLLEGLGNKIQSSSWLLNK